MFQDEIFWKNYLVWSGFVNRIVTYSHSRTNIQLTAMTRSFLVQFFQQYIQSLVPTEIVNAVLSRNWLLVHNAHLLATVTGASPQASCAYLHIYTYTHYSISFLLKTRISSCEMFSTSGNGFYFVLPQAQSLALSDGSQARGIQMSPSRLWGFAPRDPVFQ